MFLRYLDKCFRTIASLLSMCNIQLVNSAANRIIKEQVISRVEMLAGVFSWDPLHPPSRESKVSRVI